jgi:hypothetical protein
MTAGPWKPVTLCVSVAHIESVKIDYKLSEDLGTAAGHISVLAKGKCNRAVATLQFEGVQIATMSALIDETGSTNIPFELGKLLCPPYLSKKDQ